jgi:hypothetical protein
MAPVSAKPLNDGGGGTGAFAWHPTKTDRQQSQSDPVIECRSSEFGLITSRLFAADKKLSSRRESYHGLARRCR